MLGTVLLCQGERGEAEKNLRLAGALSEGLLREKLNSEDDKVSSLRMVASSSMQLGIFYEGRDPQLAQQHYLRAIEVLGKLSKAAPADPKYLLQLGSVEYRLGLIAHVVGHPEDAATHFRRARETMALLVQPPKGAGDPPGPPGACEDTYATFLAVCPDESFRNPALAVELALKATSRAKDKSEYWTTLGAAYYRAGKVQEALAALKQAVELRKAPNGADLFLLALVHHRAGHLEEARTAYQQAIAWVQQHNADFLELRLLRAEAEVCVAPLAHPPANP
jgi:tetratricopeptide (TPR) repeat protein